MIRSTALPLPPRGRAESSASVVMVGSFCSCRPVSNLSARSASADMHSRRRHSFLFGRAWCGVSACRHPGIAVAASPLSLTDVGAPTSAAKWAPGRTLRTLRLKVSARRHRNASRAVPRPTRLSHVGACGTRHTTKVHPTPS
jgi:hypothetical protein